MLVIKLGTAVQPWFEKQPNLYVLKYENVP